MKKVKVIIYILIIIWISSYYLGEFQEKKEIEQLELITMIGLDSKHKKEAEDNKFVTLTFLRNPIESSSENSSKQEGKSNEYSQEGETLSIEDTTYNKAFNKAQRFSDKTFVGDSIKYFIIGEETAKEGFEKEVDFLSRNYEFRINSKVIITKDSSAREMLEKAEPKLYKKFDNIIENTEQAAQIKELSFIDVLKSMSNSNKAGVIPLIEMDDTTGKEEINFSGFAIYNNAKIIGYLDNEETRDYGILRYQLKSISVDVSDSDLGYIALGLTSSNHNIDFEFENNELKKIKYNIRYYANIEEIQYEINVYNDEDIGKIEKLASQSMQARIKKITDKENELGADFLRISDVLSSLHPKEWRSLKENWDQTIKNVEFEINVDCTISRSYDIKEPNK